MFSAYENQVGPRSRNGIHDVFPESLISWHGELHVIRYSV